MKAIAHVSLVFCILMVTIPGRFVQQHTPRNITEKQKNEIFKIFLQPSCACIHHSKCKYIPQSLSGVAHLMERFRFDHCSNASDYCCPFELINNSTQPVGPIINKNGITSHMCGQRFKKGVGYKSGSTSTPTTVTAAFGEFPWMAAVFENTFICGGSIIHPRVVLTAAHCVFSPDEELSVRLGEYDPSNTNELHPHVDRKVDRVILHPEFNSGTAANNIALLILNENVTFTQHIQPICLPQQNESVQSTQCYVPGWGTNPEQTSNTFSSPLKRTKLGTVTHDDCQARLKIPKGPNFSLSSTIICAGGDGADVCKGYGGGPLACPIRELNDTYQQVGIVLWGEGCGTYPGFYTNVPLYVDWIKEQMGKSNLDYQTQFSMVTL